MKEHMLEAMKRKRYQMQEEQDHDDDELAPDREDEIVGGKQVMDSKVNENEHSQEGERGFAAKEVHASPENSKNKFVNPKEDTHDPVDLNANRNMAGGEGGIDHKYDDMGVDVHKPVREQSSMLAKHNAMKGEAIKKKAASVIGSKMHVNMKNPGKGEDSADAEGNHELQINHHEDEEEGSSPYELKGLKKARGKLDSFIAKIKRD